MESNKLDKVFRGVREYTRNWIEIPKEDAKREIRSYKGSYKQTKKMHRHQKNNFPFSLNILHSHCFLILTRPNKQSGKDPTRINIFAPVSGERMKHASMKFFISKGKIGFEVQCYKTNLQANCYFSKFSRKLLLVSRNKETYSCLGQAKNPMEVAIDKMAGILNWLFARKFRFRIVHERFKEQVKKEGSDRMVLSDELSDRIILTYVMRDYHCYTLVDDGGDYSHLFFRNFNAGQFVKIMVFGNLRKLIAYQNLGERGADFAVFNVGERGIKRQAEFSVEGKCFINREVSEDIELIVVDFHQKMEFYMIRDGKKVELVYHYRKKRELTSFINFRNDAIIVVRRGRIVTISEFEYNPRDSSDEGKYYISKFKI